MKLMNFNSLNSDHLAKGLSSSSKLDKAIFEEFKENRNELTNLAQKYLRELKIVKPDYKPKTQIKKPKLKALID